MFIAQCYFDVIDSVQIDRIKFFSRDIAKCTFDTHKYSLIFLVHVGVT
jgi:hypothetical protein